MRVARAGLPPLRALALGAGVVLLNLPAAAADTQVSAEGAANAKLHVRIGPGRGGGERKVEPGEPARSGEAPASEERTREDAAEGSEDGELRSLREAERELFPEARTQPYPELDAEIPLAIERPGPALNLTGLPSAAPPARSAKPASSIAWARDLTPPDLPCSYEQRTLDYIKFYRD